MRTIKYALKRLALCSLVLLLFFSSIAPYASANIAMPDSSVDSSVPLTVTPSLNGQSTWYYDDTGKTQVINAITNQLIGEAYRYKTSSGSTVTMINPGSIRDWAVAFGGNEHQVIEQYTNGSITTYLMTPPAPKTAFERLDITQVITASSATYSMQGDKIYVTPPEGAPEITKFEVREPMNNACYNIGDIVNIDIEAKVHLASANKLKYIEVYYKDTETGIASTLQRWDNVDADQNGNISKTIAYEIQKEAQIEFYIRALDTLDRFDTSTEQLQNQVGMITPVGLKIHVCGQLPTVDPDGKIPYYKNGQNWLESPDLADGKKLLRVDDTANETVLGRYRYPTIYDGHWSAAQRHPTLNGYFAVEVPFFNTGHDANGQQIDRSQIAFAYSHQPYYHLIPEGGNTSRNVIEVEKVGDHMFKDVYNGNPEYMKVILPKHKIAHYDTGEIYGEYYYIRQIAYYAGGYADNTENAFNDYNDVNPTWLRFMRTSWPDLETFKLNKPDIQVGESSGFDFEGWEYVSEGRTKVQYKITGTFVGMPANATGTPAYTPGQEVVNLEGELNSKKAKTNEQWNTLYPDYTIDQQYMNPNKPTEYEAGLFVGDDIGDFTPAGCGTFEFTLHIDDEVMRYAEDKTFTVTIPCECVDANGNPIPCEPPPPPPGGGGGGGECKISIEVSENITMDSTMPDDMLADPIGSILEDDETDSEIFDVLDYGIPSDEMLKLWGESERYLSDFKWQKYTGTVTYTIHVDKTYNLTWKTRVSRSCSDGNGGYYDCSYDVPQSATEVLETDIDEVHVISYWQIGHLVIYKFNDLIFKNYAIPNGEVVVYNDRHDMIVNAIHSAIVEDHVFPKDCENITLPSQSLDGGYSRPVPDAAAFQEEAQAAVDAGFSGRIPDVANDFVEITKTSKDRYGAETLNETVLYMDNTTTPSHGPTPIPIPKSDRVDLEMRNQHIDPLKVNKWQTESSITANYVPIININKEPEPLITFTNTSDTPDKINKVTVHTPVVMYGLASDDKKHDQRTNPPKRGTKQHCAAGECIETAEANTERHAFILDRPFTIALPTYGQHINEPGYGDRDYAKYYKSKQVKFPFDVYLKDKAGFVPANSWITIPVEQELTEFFMPVWVPEGQYTIKYRGIAINEPTADNPYHTGAPHVNYDRIPIAQDTTIEEHEANRNLSFRTENELMDHHVAYDTIEVDVVGRLYDMRISDILDFNWQNVFRSTDGLLTHTGANYWVGTKMIDGDPRGNTKPYVLPVRHGSHGLAYPNEMKNVAVKTGYQFRFDFKTKGTMYRNNDAIRITPSFYFVDYQGNREEVDLYYHDDNKYFVKIGSDADKTYREVILNDVLRGVDQEELVATGDFAYRHITDYNQRYQEVHAEVGIKEKFINKYIKDLSKMPIQTGNYAFQVLNGSLRTFMGPEEDEVPTCGGLADCTMVEAEDIVAREQHWYGEYSLPANVYVVEKQVPQVDANGNEIPQVDKIAGYGQQHRLNENAAIFKKKGYIIVNFNIETLANGNVNESHLTYHTSPYQNAPLNNQWKMEGFEYQFVDGYGSTFNLLDGDMIFYHADRSSYDDFDSNVTH